MLCSPHVSIFDCEYNAGATKLTGGAFPYLLKVTINTFTEDAP